MIAASGGFIVPSVLMPIIAILQNGSPRCQVAASIMPLFRSPLLSLFPIDSHQCRSGDSLLLLCHGVHTKEYRVYS